MNKKEYYKNRIESVLQEILDGPSSVSSSDSASSNSRLHEAMKYSVLNGGKRVRPLLVYATGEALNIEPCLLDRTAAAIELIHAYSLVHDDLPCMDDDDLRRGKPTTHIAYDEATAVLVGDALQTLAFQVLLEPIDGICTKNQLKILQTLTFSSGADGMVKGQMIDLRAVGKSLTENQLETMHKHKTGALIRATVLMASYCKNDYDNKNDEYQRSSLIDYADAIGLAFQVRDDILDIQSDTETLGKQQGADIAAGKPTYPSIIGMPAAKDKLFQLHNNAIDALQSFGDEANLLREIATFIVKRIT